nr:sushi, von Willebrand factor type A, EGF and pentraxin domain-containing protein 1-like [Parasteatoda tepidariorum]
MTNGRIMNRESKVATNSFIGADVPANLVERYFVVVIHWKSGHIAKIVGLMCQPPTLPKDIIIGRTCGIHSDGICEVTCRINGLELWKSYIRCLKNGQWENPPSCVPRTRSPIIELIKCSHLPESIEDLSTCIRIKMAISASTSSSKSLCQTALDLFVKFGNCTEISEDCTVTCGTSTMTLFCLEEGSMYPQCIPPKLLKCPELKFAKLINCSREKDTSCKIQCPDGNFVPQEAICLPSGEWSPLPSCHARFQCASEPLPSDILFINTTCKTSQSISCRVGCQVYEYEPKNESYSKQVVFIKEAYCGPAGHWENLPDCQTAKLHFWNKRIDSSYCSDPEFDRNAILQNGCLTREGSICLLKCKEGYEPNGLFILRCLKKKWISEIRCSVIKKCQSLPGHLKFVCNCRKTAGLFCRVQCLSGIPRGSKTVYCSYSSKWMYLPLCLSKSYNKTSDCLPKFLPPYLKFVDKCTFKSGEICQVKCTARFVLEDCSSKSSGEYCFLECRENGTFPKANKIKCLDGLHWSILPICACPPPIITEELVFKTNCIHVVPSGNCTLSCKGHALLVGNPLITCRADMTWTNLPRCKKVFCSKPVVPSTVFLSEHCISKSPGEHCSVECGYSGRILGPNKITCLESLRWSSFPKCACPPPMLPDNLSLKENCSDKHPGERCSLACDKKKFAQDIDYIYCQNLTYNWGLFPTCKRKTCTKMKLPKTLSYVGDCSGIIPGKTCQVECKEGGKLHGSRYIKCINGVLWTSMPNCSCPSPDLPDNMEADANCNDIRIGERCRLKCRKPFHLTGKSDIVCQTNTRWTSTPVCKNIMCPVPDLPNYLDFYDDCSSKLIGQKCHLECKEGGTFIGSNTLICLKANNLFSWSPFPSCTCPPPALSNGLKSVENCDYKKRGETCSLACIGNAAIIGINYITCQNNTKWTSLPKCRNLFCFRPNPPKELLFQEDCSNKNIGDSCAFECRHGGKTIPNNTISCLTFKHWSAFPNCSCPSPVFPNNLHLLEDCSLKQPGEICRVTCKEKSLNLYHSSIRCGKDFRWGIFPSCKLKNCPKPVLPNYISLDDDCNSKKPGDVCKVVCKMGGISVGNDFIRCLRDLKWTSFPFCTCPSPKLRQGMLSIENCTFKIPGEKCRIKCHESLKLEGKSFVLCRNDNRWNIESKCHKKFCPKPNLPSHLLFNENCSLKSVKERCELLCKHGGELMKRSFIECYSSLKWSKFPQCTCPLPVLNKNLKFREEVCFNKTAGEKCLLKCKTKQKAPEKIYLRCLQGGTWTNLPKCTVSKKNKINLK